MPSFPHGLAGAWIVEPKVEKKKKEKKKLKTLKNLQGLLNSVVHDSGSRLLKKKWQDHTPRLTLRAFFGMASLSSWCFARGLDFAIRSQVLCH